MIRVCLVGIGKTGKEIAKHLLEEKDIKIVSVISGPNSDKYGKDLGEIIGSSTTGIIIERSDNLQNIIFKTKPDVAIDFSTPKASIKNAKIFAKMKVNMVIGTTGFSNLDLKKLLVLTRRYRNGIVYAPNITLGVNVLMLLTNLVANILNEYDFQITEIHHKHKKDAPSGTAIKIAKEIEKGLRYAGKENSEIKIPISAVRAGGVIGKHEVMIVGEEDKIEISHESFSRKAFAVGAIRAVQFIYRKSGYYEMSDVLNLKKILVDYVKKDGNSFSRKYVNYFSEMEKSKDIWA